jgi:hypothetical protein
LSGQRILNSGQSHGLWSCAVTNYARPTDILILHRKIDGNSDQRKVVMAITGLRKRDTAECGRDWKAYLAQHLVWLQRRREIAEKEIGCRYGSFALWAQGHNFGPQRDSYRREFGGAIRMSKRTASRATVANGG